MQNDGYRVAFVPVGGIHPAANKEHIVKKHLIIGLIFCLCGTANAGIYKWTDENGKVHYGDKKADAKNGAELKIKASEAPVQKEAGAEKAAGEMSSENSPATMQTDNLQKCLAMARIQADKNSRNPAEIRADSKMLLDLCPGTSYSCVTYIERPEANRCVAEPMQAGGSILRNRTYQR